MVYHYSACLLQDLQSAVIMSYIIKLLTTDLLTQAITQSPLNYLPRPGMCGTIRPLPRAQAQQLHRNGTLLFFNTLQNQLNAPFCLGLIANTVKEPTLLYIYDNSLIQVGNLTVRGDSIIFNLNGQDAFLPGNFSGFAQLQLCANSTHINLYTGCQFSMAVQFSASGVSEMAVISLFTPFLSSTPQFDVSCSHSKNNGMKFIPKKYDLHPNEFHTYGMN